MTAYCTTFSLTLLGPSTAGAASSQFETFHGMPMHPEADHFSAPLDLNNDMVINVQDLLLVLSGMSG